MLRDIIKENEEFNDNADELFHKLKKYSKGKTYEDGLNVGKVCGTYQVLKAVNEVLTKLYGELK